MERNNSNEWKEDDSGEEKPKKNKKFIFFLSRFIEDNEDESKNRKDSDVKPKSFLDILKDFKLTLLSEEAVNDDEKTDSAYDIEITSDAKQYVKETLKTGMVKLSETDFDQEADDDTYVDTILLIKVKECLDGNIEIDVDKIIKETLELVQKNAVNMNEDIVEDKDESNEVNYEETSNEQERLNNELSSVHSVTPNIVKNDTAELAKSKDNLRTIHEKAIQIPNSKPQPKPNEQHEQGASKYPTTSFDAPNKTVQLNGRTPARNQNNPNIIRSINLSSIASEKRPQKLNFKNLPVRKLPTASPSVDSSHFETSQPSRNISPDKIKQLIRVMNNAAASESPYHLEKKNYKPSDIETLHLAEKVFFENVSLRKIYENSDLRISDLRQILSGESKKRKLSKDLKRALAKRHNNYSDILANIKNPIRIDKSKISSNISQKTSNLPNELVGHGYKLKNSSSNIFHADKHPDNKLAPTQTKPLLTIIVFMIILLVLILALVFFVK